MARIHSYPQAVGLIMRGPKYSGLEIPLHPRGTFMTSFTRRDLLRSGLALSASTLAAGSVGRAHALLAAYPGAASAEAQSAVAPREHPWMDEAYAAAHGGLWRAAYAPRSALGLAALLGFGGARA